MTLHLHYGGPRKHLIEIFSCLQKMNIFCAPKNPPNWVWKFSLPKKTHPKNGAEIFDTQTDGPLDVKEWPLPRVFCGKSFGGSFNRWRNVAGKISGISPLKKECSVWVEKPVMTRRQVMRFKVGILPETKLYHDPGKRTCYKRWRQHFFSTILFMVYLVVAIFLFFWTLIKKKQTQAQKRWNRCQLKV